MAIWGNYMLKDFLMNVTIFVAFISFINQIYRNTGLYPSLPVRDRILSGIIFGLMGIMLMVFGIHFENKIILDFPTLAVFLSAYGGGWPSSITSALIISVGRVLFYGLNKVSLIAIVVISILTIVVSIITNLTISKKRKWLFCIGISEIISIIGFSNIVTNNKLLLQILTYYCTSMIVISIFLYYYISYLQELTNSFRRYKQESYRDFLTGLNNVRQFDRLFNNKVKSCINSKENIALLYIDIDFFKRVNDTYGHKEGDMVLKVIGEILEKTCRCTDVVSRNGGEEFSVILSNCPWKNAVEIAENIRKSVEKTSIELSNKTKLNITVSIGVACYPDPIKDIIMLREKADMALYEAKRSGRNKVIFVE